MQDTALDHRSCSVQETRKKKKKNFFHFSIFRFEFCFPMTVNNEIFYLDNFSINNYNRSKKKKKGKMSFCCEIQLA